MTDRPSIERQAEREDDDDLAIFNHGDCFDILHDLSWGDLLRRAGREASDD